MNRYCKHCSAVIDVSLKGHSCRECKNGLYRYGMTRTDQEVLLNEQDCKCAICDKDIQLFEDRKGGFIDHCHTTNKVRGVLCLNCNTMLGRLESSFDIKSSKDLKDVFNKIESYLLKEEVIPR